MPARERTTLTAIVDAAFALLEAGGLEAVTMQAVAQRVGIRAPSLYKRVRDRDALVGLVVGRAVDGLGALLAETAARSPDDPRRAFVALAEAVRAFAHAHPAAFRLVFNPLPDAARADVDALARASAPVLSVAARLAGEAEALEAARLVTASLTGFLLMELSGAFRLGGDVDRAYAWGVERLLHAVAVT